MAKAEKTAKVVKVVSPAVITLTLNEREAGVLKGILGGISGANDIYSIFDALDDAGVESISGEYRNLSGDKINYIYYVVLDK